MEDEVESVESVDVDEFDVGTRIDRMSDGSVRLRLGLMPPSWATRESGFDSFQDDLGRALGVEVEGLDKELFAIPAPVAADLVPRTRAFLLSLRDR